MSASPPSRSLTLRGSDRPSAAALALGGALEGPALGAREAVHAGGGDLGENAVDLGLLLLLALLALEGFLVLAVLGAGAAAVAVVGRVELLVEELGPAALVVAGEAGKDGDRKERALRRPGQQGEEAD